MVNSMQQRTKYCNKDVLLKLMLIPIFEAMHAVECPGRSRLPRYNLWLQFAEYHPLPHGLIKLSEPLLSVYDTAM